MLKLAKKIKIAMYGLRAADKSDKKIRKKRERNDSYSTVMLPIIQGCNWQ